MPQALARGPFPWFTPKKLRPKVDWRDYRVYKMIFRQAVQRGSKKKMTKK